MTLYNRLVRIPRPRTFLYLMSLRTGTELSTLTLLLNKVSGLYGLLALLTGLHLSGLQLSMYIYSLAALVLVALLAPHIRTGSAFECLALAVFFALDTLINAVYTTVFAVTWFLVVSRDAAGAGVGGEGDGVAAGGAKMMGDAAGFTSPEVNVSHVEVVVGGEEAQKNGEAVAGVAYPHVVTSRRSVDGVVMQPESMSSIFVICALWAVRLYLVLIVMSYARMVLRRHIMVTAAAGRNIQLHAGSRDKDILEDPFAMHLPEGQGWKGKTGRFMVGLGRSYWLGAEEGDEGWMDQEMGHGRKGSRSGVASPVEVPGVVERERRRRSGTGPPPPTQVPLLQSHQQPPQHFRLQEVRDGI